MSLPSITFEKVFDTDDEWVSDSYTISTEENLAKIQNVLENIGSVIIEHWHFYGSRAPTRKVFDDMEDFEEYLKENAIAGDAIHAWNMHELCNNENELVSGKCPDQNGLIPKSGAY